MKSGFSEKPTPTMSASKVWSEASRLVAMPDLFFVSGHRPANGFDSFPAGCAPDVMA